MSLYIYADADVDIIENFIKALEPFAEKPSEAMDSYPCHVGILPKERCGRCSRAITAFNALEAVKERENNYGRLR